MSAGIVTDRATGRVELSDKLRPGLAHYDIVTYRRPWWRRLLRLHSQMVTTPVTVEIDPSGLSGLIVGWPKGSR